MNQKKSMATLLFAATFLASTVVAEEAAKPAENNPPSVNGIPGESIQEGGKFAAIKLDEFVSDPEDAPATLRWSISGNKGLVVTEANRVVTIKTPDQYWNGSEDLTFTATDPKGQSGSETVNFTVESVNNPPVVSKIEDQSVDEGQKFKPIKLDDFVNDPDHPKDQISWEYELTATAKNQAEGELTVDISKDRIANVVIPDTNWYGAYSITFIATDAEYASGKATANFVVRSVNDAPIVQKAPDQTINEKEQFEPINLSDLVSDVDDDASKIKWSVDGGKDLKVKIDKYGVAEIAIPNENWNGPTETFTFTAIDPQGAKSSFKTSFTVKSVNDAPEFVDQIPDQDIQEKEQFKPIQLDKFVKDPDHAFEQLKWTFSGNKDLKVQLEGKTAKILIPNAIWNGSETIGIKVTDPEGASAETQASFTVESVNDPPKFVREIPSQTIDEKKKFEQIKLDDFVEDGDHKKSDLSWEVDVKTVGKEPAAGPLNINIDEKRIATIEIPDTYWNGAATATFKVTDPEGAEAKQVVNLNVRSINDIPVFKKIADQIVDEKTEFESFSLDDYLSDADNDLSQLKISVSGEKDLTVSVDKNRLVSIKTPDINWNGAETITFTATDPENGKASTTAKFTVKSINDPPVMTDIPDQTVKEKELFKPIDLDKFVSDVDHDKKLLKWIIGGNKDIKVSLDNSHKASFSLPNKNWNGAETITFKVTDPEGASDERTVNFTVESVNDSPEFVKKIPDQTIAEKAQFKPINLAEMIKDPDHKISDLSLSIDVKPAAGSPKGAAELQVNVDAKMVATIAIPDKYWNGSNTITFTVSDPEGAKAVESATFTVSSINDAPTLKEIASQTIDEKAQFASINLADLANDPDHSFDKLKWTVSGNKDLKVNIDKAGTATIAIPDRLWNGTEKITFTVTDPENASAKQTAVFSVKSINDPPVMKDIPSQTIKEKQEFKAIDLDNFVSDLDNPNEKLKWNISGNKDLAYKIDAGRKFTVVIPNKNWHGSETFNIEVSDPEGAKDSRKVTFTVESVNDAPEFVKKINSQTIDEKKGFAPIDLDEIVKDPDHKTESLTWAFDVKPAPGSPKNAKTGLKVSVDPKTGKASILTPDKYWNGADQIEFIVTDPEGAKASQTALFTVRSINDSPTFKNIGDQIVMEKEDFKDIDLSTLVSDPDDPFNTLKWTITGNKDLKISISKNGLATVKAPNKLWNGTEKVTFAVADPQGASVRQTVQFTAKSINDPPVMKDIPSQTIKEKQEFKAIDLDNFVSDLDHPNGKLKWNISGNKALRFVLSPNRKLSVSTPDKDWNGKESVTITVIDPEGAKDSRVVDFEVISVNDAPVFVKEIKDQTIDEKKQFSVIKLDDFIQDPDHKKSELQWSAKISGASAKAAPAAKKSKKGKKNAETEEPVASSKSGLSVEIDGAHNAKIVIPDKYWNGAANISFTATDPEGAKAVSSALFTVRTINDLPIISSKAPDGETIREGGKFKTIDLSTLATDPDHPTNRLKWSFSGDRQLQVVLNKDNTVQIKTPNAQWFGKESITFTVTDPEGGRTSQKMDFVVTQVNDPPVISKISGQKIKEKEQFKAISLDDFVKDPDNKPSEMRWKVSGNKHLEAEITSARKLVVTGKNKFFWCKPDTLKLVVTDPQGATDSTSVIYEITSVNDSPVMKDIPGQTVKEKILFKDIPLDNYVFDPDHRNSQLKWTAVVRKSAASADNSRKSAVKGKKGKKAGNAIEEKKTSNDLTVSIDEKHVAHFGIPDKYWNGKRTVVFTVEDPEGATDSKSVNFEVISVNDPPMMANIPDQKIREKEQFKPIDLMSLVKDPDNAISSLKFETSQSRALKTSINAKKQLVVTTPDKYWSGSEKITVTVTDPEGGKASQQVVFEVTPVNDPPTMKTIPGQKIKEKDHFAPIDLSKYVTDPDNRINEINWTVSGNKSLKVEIRGSRAAIVTPDEFWNGSETLTFTATDPAGASASDKATFAVTPVNDPPHFNKMPTQTIREKGQFQPLDLSKLVVDPDDKTTEMRWSLDDGMPAQKDRRGRMGKAKRSTIKHPLSYDLSDAGVLTVSVPNEYWNGSDKVRINAFDPSGEKASIEVNFMVTPVNDAPVLKNIPDQVTNEGTKFNPIQLSNYVSDPDNKPQELRWSVSGNRHLEVMITGGREAVVRPSRVDWSGKEELTFVVKDPVGATAKTTVNFEVKHVNAVPEIRPIRDVTIREDANKGVLAVIKLDQYVRDRDNSFSELKWEITGNKHLVVDYDRAQNIATIKQPHENWSGAPETITFKVTDPEGASAKTSARFTVNEVNDAPVAMSQAFQTKEGEAIKVSAKDGLMNGAFDPDGKLNATVSLVRRPQNGKVDINERDGSFTYTPNKGFYGLDEFSFKLTDREGASSKVETAEINVNFKMKDIRDTPASAKQPAASSSSSTSKTSKANRRR